MASSSTASGQSQANQAANQVYNVLNSKIENLKQQQTTIINNYPTPSLLPLPPALGNWTQVNYGGSISDNENGYIYLQAPASSAYSLRMLTLPINGTAYTLKASFRQLFPVSWTTSGPSYACGLVLRNSTSGQVIFFYVSFFGGIQFGVNQYSNPTTYTGTAFYTGWPTWVNNTCIGIQETATTRIYSWSNDDGLHWMPAYSEPAGTFTAPDQVGICADSEDAASAVGITLNGWQLTTP
ncbi:MAG TPA: hypothetical protein VHU83_06645 [Bryobacteraceae bacterium]|nr:hypothetical protein [Bryobacteraceae bacterium]